MINMITPPPKTQGKSRSSNNARGMVKSPSPRWTITALQTAVGGWRTLSQPVASPPASGLTIGGFPENVIGITLTREKCDGTEGAPNLVGRPMSDDRFPLIYGVMGGAIIALYVALGLLMVPELLPASTLANLLNGVGAPAR